MYRLVIDVPDIQENLAPVGVSDTEHFNAIANELVTELFPGEAYRVYFQAFVRTREIVFRSEDESYLAAIDSRVTECAGELRAGDVVKEP